MSDLPTGASGLKRSLRVASIIILALALIAAIYRHRPASSEPPGTPAASGPLGERWTNAIGMDFVRIPSGSFTMGSRSRAAASHEKPPHTVTISRSFYIATTEVTQAQWTAVCGGNPSRFQGDDLPVERVSWHDAKEFIRRLNVADPSTVYRLPTEAEWEFACRAGSTGDGHGDPAAVAWFAPTSGGTTHRVGLKRANAWGLHDMLGNVYEWCEDWKGSYPSVSVTDPRGPSSGSFRVVRGGSWRQGRHQSRCAYRSWAAPMHRSDDNGFRCCYEP